jgi:3-hydroxyisobutyrate dehydrogenase
MLAARLHCNLRFVRHMSASVKPTIGFVGLGNMGGHMANNLLKHGYPLVVFDLNATAVANAVAKGAKKASSPAEVAEHASTIVTMLPSSPHVRSVYLTDAHSIVNGLKRRADGGKSAFLMDSSTIDPTAARSVAQDLKAATGATMLDAPVSGGVLGAGLFSTLFHLIAMFFHLLILFILSEAGTLTFMVGAEAAEFERAKVILACMGKNIVHCGASGTGQVAKVCNNLILAISMAGVSEAMNLGVKLGADPKVLAGIVNTSSGRCWSSDTYNPVPGVLPGVPSSRGYTGTSHTAFLWLVSLL